VNFISSHVSKIIPVALLAIAVWAGPADAQVRQGGRTFRLKPLKDAVSMRGATLEDASLPLSETKKQNATIDVVERGGSPVMTYAPVVYCVYLQGEKRGRYQLGFWDGSKPTTEVRWGVYPVEIDAPVQACPATWGEAVALGWGPEGWAKAVAEQRVFQAENDAYAATVEAKMRQGTPEKQAEAWQARAASMPATKDADLFALASKIDADISSLESSLDALNSRPFNDKLVGPDGLFERINRLALAAYAKSSSLKPGPAGRPSFDEWDERLGGPALTAINRLQKIVYYRQNRRVRLSEALGGDAGKSEMASWGYVDFGPMWPAKRSLLEVFSRHLDGRPLIDPVFQRALTKDLERTRPSGDPGRPYYYHVPADPKPTWLMTPAEEEAQGSNIVGNLAGAASSVGDMVRLIEKVDADIRDSREAFWKCYASRCKQPGKTFYAYSFAMRSKDEFYFFMPVLLGMQLSRGMSFLGDGGIDGGPIANCAAPGNEVKGELATLTRQNAGNPVQSARAVQAVMKGPTYLAWQACRDRMEYILRPRFP
jgi:hypothetical protein